MHWRKRKRPQGPPSVSPPSSKSRCSKCRGWEEDEALALRELVSRADRAKDVASGASEVKEAPAPGRVLSADPPEKEPDANNSGAKAAAVRTERAVTAMWIMITAEALSGAPCLRICRPSFAPGYVCLKSA